MCSPVVCPTCSKTTWSGCGMHVEILKARVPADQWCTCEKKAAPKPANLSAWLPGR